MIDQCLQKIYKSEKLDFDSKKTLDSIFKIPFGREEFCKSIYQSKFKENYEHSLSKVSFDDLFELFFQVLLSEGEDSSNYNRVRLLTKSTFHYYKNVGYKQNYYIYQELKNKKGTFSIWKNDKFWLNWFTIERNEVFINPKRTVEENYFNLLLEMSRLMNMLNIDCKFILDCLIDVIAKQFITSVIFILIFRRNYLMN
jgi:hypothetical protein